MADLVIAYEYRLRIEAPRDADNASLMGVCDQIDALTAPLEEKVARLLPQGWKMGRES